MSETREEDRNSEDAAPVSFPPNLNISRSEMGRRSDALPGQTGVLSCGHQMPSDYLISWCKYNLKQKKTKFTCPSYDEYKKGICGAEFSYNELCHAVPLTASVKEFFEQRLGELAAARFCTFRTCPGCQTSVERADEKNLCVHCTICTANKGSSYEFCWNCRRKWKGIAQFAVRCGYNDCNQTETFQKKEDLPKQCQPAFKSQKLKREQIYATMEKSCNRKRLAMIINNVKFRVRDFNRHGAEKDEKSMKALLKALDYDIIILNDLSAQGMEAAVRDFSQHNEHKYSDSMFFIIMSHGGPDGIYGINYNANERDIFPVDKIFHYLNSANCPGLTDKPKIILIQACRGDRDGYVWVPDSVRCNQRTKQHLEKDFACFRSCTPDTVSIRNTGSGSVFIQSLVKIFNRHCHEDDILELFRKVALFFEEAAKESDFPYQMPSVDRTTLVKKFYLFPGL